MADHQLSSFKDLFNQEKKTSSCRNEHCLYCHQHDTEFEWVKKADWLILPWTIYVKKSLYHALCFHVF